MSRSEICEAVTAYLRGGDRQGFGRKDPFRRAVGGGGLPSLVEQITENVTDLQECPDEDTQFSAILFGKMVGASKIATADLDIVRMVMQVAYSEHVTSFTMGLTMGKIESKEIATKEMAHGGVIPSAAEAAAIQVQKGMPWQEVVAVSSVLFSGTLPVDGEIQREGYGSDPAGWAAAKERRKSKKLCFTDYFNSGDAAGYRAMIKKGATRMATSKYKTGAAMVLLFVDKLSSMTFDQKMPELFLEYCEEHLETHKGEGLYSAENPLDPTILTERVLARKAAVADHSDKLDQVLDAMQKSSAKAEAQFSSRMGDLSALQRQMATMQRQLDQKGADGGNDRNKNLPPGPDNPCKYCKSPDHFVRDCPELAKKLAAQKEAEEKAAAAAGK